MARAVGDPRLRLVVRQCERDERGPEVVHADRAPLLRGLEQLGTLDAGGLKVASELIREMVDRQSREHFGALAPSLS
jgi:hypothetical protein